MALIFLRSLVFNVLFYATLVFYMLIALPAFLMPRAVVLRVAGRLGKSTILTQNVAFYPNLQQTGEYRFTFNIGSVTKLNKWFGWQNQFGDIYVTDPPSGSKNNDVIFTTGLNVSFTH